jgi:hypothetical protein
MDHLDIAIRLRGRLRGALASAAVAVLLVVVVFPEVVLLGGSLSPVGLNDVVNRSAERHVVQLYPNWQAPTPRSRVRDVAARVFQLVPATKFMNRALRDGESPFWNPYSAAGSLGPETVADMKFSPFVLLVGLLGASATAFTVVVLLFVILALFCLQQFFTRTLGAGRMAATAACVVFLLCGFAASDIDSQIGAPYVLFPVVLYAVAEYHRVGGWGRFAIAVAAYAGFILTTFVPVQLLMLVLVLTLTVLLDSACWKPIANGHSLPVRCALVARRHVVAPAVALLVTAYVWVPDLGAVLQAGSDITSYGTRTPRIKGGLEILKLLTPWPVRGGSWAGYLGIAPLVVIVAALPRALGRQKLLLWSTTGLTFFAAAEHAGLVGFRSIARLPGFRAVRSDYWASLAGASAVVAIGIAIAVAEQRGLSVRGALVAGAAFAAWIMLALCVSALSSRDQISALGVVAALALIAVVAMLAYLGARQPSRRQLFAALALGVIALELFTSQNHARIRRFDVEKPPPSYVDFLRQRLGENRVLNAGIDGIYPEWGAALGIPQIETLNITQIPQYRTFFDEYVNPAEGGRFLQIGNGNRPIPFRANASALDLLSVRYLVVDEHLSQYDAQVRTTYPLAFTDRRAGINIYENPDPFPRAFLSPALARDDPRATTTSWSRTTTRTDDQQLLADARRLGIPTYSRTVGTVGAADITGYHNDEVRIQVHTSRPSVLVLTDTYHANWDVTVRDERAHLARVDDIVRGVVVPAGASTVIFRYRSSTRTLARDVSLITLGALAVVTGLGIRRDRRRRDRSTRDGTLPRRPLGSLT